MAEQETYEGWANRETWAFWLHVTNDQGWYESVREYTADLVANAESGAVPDFTTDYDLGEAVVGYVRDTLEELLDANGGLDSPLKGMRDEIGSWWRIDHAEIGAAARELVES